MVPGSGSREDAFFGSIKSEVRTVLRTTAIGGGHGSRTHWDLPTVGLRVVVY